MLIPLEYDLNFSHFKERNNTQGMLHPTRLIFHNTIISIGYALIYDVLKRFSFIRSNTLCNVWADIPKQVMPNGCQKLQLTLPQATSDPSIHNHLLIKALKTESNA